MPLDQREKGHCELLRRQLQSVQDQGQKGQPPQMKEYWQSEGKSQMGSQGPVGGCGAGVGCGAGGVGAGVVGWVGDGAWVVGDGVGSAVVGLGPGEGGTWQRQKEQPP